jgi:hypothetical protein
MSIPDKLRQAIDETAEVEKGATVRPDTTVSRPGKNRSRTLQIRLSDEEYQQLVAAAGDEPASAFARSVLMQCIAGGPADSLRLVGALRDALESTGYELTRRGVA